MAHTDTNADESNTETDRETDTDSESQPQTDTDTDTETIDTPESSQGTKRIAIPDSGTERRAFSTERRIDPR